MKCIICEMKIAQKSQKCTQCGFETKRPSFLSEKQYEEWINQVVRPYQREWLKKKVILEKKAAEQKAKREFARRIQKNASCLGAFGMDFSVFVKPDGSVMYIGSNEEIKRGVSKWKGIIAVAAGDFHILGLHRDGRISAAGKNNLNQCAVSSWKDVVQIAACGDVSAALDAKGKVHICGDLEDNIGLAQQWSGIIKIVLGNKHILGLCADGTVKAAGCNLDEQYTQVSKWAEVTDIAAGEYHSLALLADGSVCASGSNIDGECDIKDWNHIVQLQGASGSSVGIDRKGQLWRAGRFSDIRIKEELSLIQIVMGVRETDFAAAVLEKEEIQIYRHDKHGGTWLKL